MNVPNIDLTLRLDLFLGAAVFLAVILWLLKKGRLTVRYSIIWLMAGGALLLFAAFPYIVLVLRDWLNMEMPVNVVFTLVLAFVLLLLLSLSTIVSGFAEAPCAGKRPAGKARARAGTGPCTAQRRAGRDKITPPCGRF